MEGTQTQTQTLAQACLRCPALAISTSFCPCCCPLGLTATTTASTLALQRLPSGEKEPQLWRGEGTLEGRRNLNFGSGLPLLPCPGYLYQLLPLLLPPWGSLLQLRLLLLLLLLLLLPLLLLLLLPQFPLSCSCCLLLHLPLLPPWGSLLLTGLKSTSADDFA